MRLAFFMPSRIESIKSPPLLCWRAKKLSVSGAKGEKHQMYVELIGNQAVTIRHEISA